MYGEARESHNGTSTLNSRAQEVHDLAPTECGGYSVRITHQFPRTDITMLCPVGGPLRIRFAQDCNGDGVPETQTTAAVTFRDLDNNGVIEREVDAAHVRVIQVEAMPGAALHYTVAERLAAARRVVEMLGGKPGEIISEQDLLEQSLCRG